MASTKVLRHVILCKFKEDTTPEEITHLGDEFRTLTTVKVPQVKEYEWGTNVSKENLDHGYTHCCILTFDNEQDRDTYLVHADHLAYADIFKPHLAAITVVDFWAQS
jgi:hypothetical protein